jgi:[acyl-carrier-protein] S-malonyltransferase
MALSFVFPGQGSQAVGMGKDLYDNLDEIKKLYDEASNALGYDVAALSFNGPAEELNKTYHTQPCLLAASIASYTALKARNVNPSVVAGHSLGEYTALVAAGSLSFADAMKVTEIRGNIMQKAVPEGAGLMAAILGLESAALDALCKGVGSGYVAVANYNCPGQLVVSGEKAAVEELTEKAKEAGAKRALLLAVSVPSHSALMQDAAKQFAAALKEFAIKDAVIPFVNNVDAKVVSKGDEIRESLIRQLSMPVRWDECVKTIASQGVSTFIEVGPGKVLSGLIKRIVADTRIFNVENMESLNKTVAEILN